MSNHASEPRRCPPPPACGVPRLPSHRSRRGEELVQIAYLGAFLLGFWILRIPQAACEVTTFAVPGLQKAPSREALEEKRDAAVSVSVLLAATRWFGQIELPRSESELWSGPPLFFRPGSRLATETAQKIHQEERGDDDDFLMRVVLKLGEDAKAQEHLDPHPHLIPVDDGDGHGA